MNKSFGEYLAERKISADTIQQAARFYLAEQTNDLPPEEMRKRLVAVVGDAHTVDSALRALEQDSTALKIASLAFLSRAWEESGGAEQVTSVIEDADKSLPVIESGIIAAMVMYATYLMSTKGIKEEQETVEIRPDGSITKTKIRKLYGPTGPLSQLGRLFGM